MEGQIHKTVSMCTTVVCPFIEQTLIDGKTYIISGE